MFGNSCPAPVKKKKAIRTEVLIEVCGKYIGQKGGQCKTFVQSNARKVGITIPRNHEMFLSRFMWREEELGRDVSIHRKLSMSYWKRGDIVQVLWNPQKVQVKYHYHTFIVLSSNKNLVVVLDSNWSGDEMVQERTLPNKLFMKLADKWTVYRFIG